MNSKNTIPPLPEPFPGEPVQYWLGAVYEWFKQIEKILNEKLNEL